MKLTKHAILTSSLVITVFQAKKSLTTRFHLGYKESATGILPFFEGSRGTELTMIPRRISNKIVGILS